MKKLIRRFFYTMLQLMITVDGQELATDIYFKSEQLATLWIKHHYLFVAAMVLLLRGTRDFSMRTRRT